LAGELAAELSLKNAIKSIIEYDVKNRYTAKDTVKFSSWIDHRFRPWANCLAEACIRASDARFNAIGGLGVAQDAG
jgi:hypothetical protein